MATVSSSRGRGRNKSSAPQSPALGRIRTTSSTSDFLLLHSAIQSPVTYNLPGPRYIWVLYLGAILDLATTIYLLVQVTHWPKPPPLGGLFTCGLIRPFVVIWVASNKRVRDRGWVLLAQIAVTFLVSTYHFNELVQSRPDEKHPKHSKSHAFISASSSLRPSQTATYLFVSLGFSFLHYLLYGIVVGIRRRLPPDASGRRSSSRGPWVETTWEGRISRERSSLGRNVRRGSSQVNKRGLESPALMPVAGSSSDLVAQETSPLLGASEPEIQVVRAAGLGIAGPDGVEEEEVYVEGDSLVEDWEGDDDESDGGGSDEGDVLDSSDDEDAIIDIPKPGDELRRRGSRMNIRAALDEEMGGSTSRDRESVRGSGELRAVTNYGSISTLVGI